jgi:hypothetical protein
VVPHPSRRHLVRARVHDRRGDLGMVRSIPAVVESQHEQVLAAVRAAASSLRRPRPGRRPPPRSRAPGRPSSLPPLRSRSVRAGSPLCQEGAPTDRIGGGQTDHSSPRPRRLIPPPACHNLNASSRRAYPCGPPGRLPTYRQAGDLRPVDILKPGYDGEGGDGMRRFNPSSSHAARAVQCWQILVGKAKNRQTVTYKGLSELMYQSQPPACSTRSSVTLRSTASITSFRRSRRSW